MKFFNTGIWLRRLRGALLITVFIIVFLYIFSLNFRTHTRMDLLQRSVTETVSPPIQLFGRIYFNVEDFFKDYIWLKGLRGENESLKTQVAELQGELTSYKEAYVENQRLRRLLDFKTTIKAETVPAEVVMHDLTGWFQTLMVDKGFHDGIAPDMPVVNDEGVIGRVLDVSDHHCRVLLITDQGSSVDAVDQRNRVRGIVCGKDANGCLLKYVRGNLDTKEGDLVITSGKDGIFPKGLRLGVIEAVYKDPVDLFQKIEVKSLVRMSALEEVLIIKDIREGLDAEPEGPPAAALPEAQSHIQTGPAAEPQAALKAKPLAKSSAQTISKAGHAEKPELKPVPRTNPKYGPKTHAASRPKPRNKPQSEPQGRTKPEPKVN